MNNGPRIANATPPVPVRLEAHLAMLSRYNRWANMRLYDAVARLPAEQQRLDVGLFFGSLHATLNHILLADRIWLFRLTGEEPEEGSPARILHEDFAELQGARERTDARLVRAVDELARSGAGAEVQFRMRSSVEVKVTAAAVLSHVFNHQSHHRGQAHAAMTILGAQSVELDLLVFELECAAAKCVAGARR